MKPMPMSRAGLVQVLEDIRTHVEAGDSFEGSIQYLMPEPEDPEDVEFRVQASYRFGNLQGQGSMHLIGDLT